MKSGYGIAKLRSDDYCVKTSTSRLGIQQEGDICMS